MDLGIVVQSSGCDIFSRKTSLQKSGHNYRKKFLEDMSGSNVQH